MKYTSTKVGFKMLAGLLAALLMWSVFFAAWPMEARATESGEFTVSLSVPLNGAEVALTHKESGEVWKQKTNDGVARFREELDPAANYRLSVKGAVGYRPYEKEIDLSVSPLEVTLSPLDTVILTGVLNDTTGAALPGVQVKASGYHNAEAKTAADGAFSLELYSGQSYSVKASKNGYQDKTLFNGEIDEAHAQLGSVVLDLRAPARAPQVQEVSDPEPQPEVPQITIGGVTPSGWTNGTKTISYTVTPGSADVYCVIGKGTLTSISEILAEVAADKAWPAGKTTTPADENGEYYIYAVNGEHVVNEKVTVSQIDKVSPVISNSQCELKSAGDAEITFHVSDNGAIKRVYYSKNASGVPSLGDVSPSGGVYKIFTIDFGKTMYLFAEDEAGNKSEGSSSVRVTNPSGPEITVPDNYDDGWDNTKEITFTVKPAVGRDVAEVTYGLSGGVFVAATESDANAYSMTVTQKGTYIIEAKDSAGQINRLQLVFDNMDTTAPVISQKVKNPAANASGWNQGAFTLTVTVSETESGIDRVVYSLNPNYTTYESASAAIGALHPATGSNGVYTIQIPNDECDTACYIWAIDKAGNVSQNSDHDVPVRIDRTPPSVDSATYSRETADGFIRVIRKIFSTLLFGMYKDKVVVKVEASDGGTVASGVAGYQYQMAPKRGAKSDWKGIEPESGSDPVRLHIPYQEFEGQIYVRAVDAAGNYSADKTDTSLGGVIMDKGESKKAPDIDSHEYVEKKWTNQDVVLTLSGSEPFSGVDHYEYSFTPDDERLPEVGWTRMPESDGALHLDEETHIPNQITVSQNCNGTFKFRAVSNTGVESTKVTEFTVRVWKNPPANATVSLAPVNGENGWYVGDFDAPGIELTEPAETEHTPPITTYYKLVNTTTGEETSEKRFSSIHGDRQPVVNADGVYSLLIWTKDEAGNECDPYTETIKVDTTAPTDLSMEVDGASVAAQNENEIDFTLFYNRTIHIKLSADCDISGLGRLEYQWGKSLTEIDTRPEGIWLEYPQSGIEMKPNRKFILCFRAVDLAGNKTLIYSDGIILDNQAPTGDKLSPEITLTPEKPNRNGFYNKDVSVDISVSDPKYSDDDPDEATGVRSALKNLSYRVLTDGAVTLDTTVLFPSDQYPYKKDTDGRVPSWSGKIVIDSKQNNSNDVVLEITAVDNAGNTRITRTPAGALKIDTTPPSIQVRYDNNSDDPGFPGYFKAARTATVVVTERNFNAADVVAAITAKGAQAPRLSAWRTVKGTGNLDDTTHTATIAYTADADYTFGIDYTDLADNRCPGETYAPGTAAPKAFTVDKTLPVVSVHYNNNSVTDGKYFSQERTATITIHEHNFETSRIKVDITASLGGSGIARPQVGGWRTSGDMHTASIRYAADGDYTFDIAYTDKAGNAAREAGYGNSAAPRDFTVDTTIVKPVITINGEDGNGKSYRGDVLPSVLFSDINFASYEIVLLRTRLFEKDVDVTRLFTQKGQPGASGGEVTVEGFDKIQDNDGIYTLTAKMTDHAGNTESESIAFSVNRFGSVYVFDKYLTSLRDSYVQKVSDQLIVTEYNPDKLLQDSLKIDISCDGAPLSKVKYDVSPVPNDLVSVGASGWYQYEYKIDPSNCDKDGIYRIRVSSRDAAGNAPENTNYVDKAVQFCVDTVAPELTNLTGLEKNSVNAQSVSVKFDVFDAIALNKVDVYVGEEVRESFANFEDMTQFSGSFSLGEGIHQRVRLVITDKAGNVTDTSSESFTTPLQFEREVTISTNFFVRYYANTWLFWGTVGGLVIAILGLLFLLFFLKRRKEEKEETA